ncbi:helix-turn-helix domain-containing protein [Lentisphaerota bacterium WC36G]|nr:helix-turn-helix domain-containing protein [Lentisphaerae bacterium WC36]
MKIKNQINSAIIQAATAMLQPFIPELTPTKLIDALQSFSTEASTEIENSNTIPKLYTVAEVMKILGVSKPTIYRMFKNGKLKKIEINENTTRISSADLEKILNI